ncbi:unnamed protein product [Acanthosepion pharaonis]|uniref:Uncharacterized protein n=1 Tax=Acanthosepion pharaonis TaxID=158019 RepID=A0A812E3J8_ACAPH|nr:unnamed protein product [Sepia pharaonis]
MFLPILHSFLCSLSLYIISHLFSLYPSFYHSFLVCFFFSFLFFHSFLYTVTLRLCLCVCVSARVTVFVLLMPVFIIFIRTPARQPLTMRPQPSSPRQNIATDADDSQFIGEQRSNPNRSNDSFVYTFFHVVNINRRYKILALDSYVVYSGFLQ